KRPGIRNYRRTESKNERRFAVIQEARQLRWQLGVAISVEPGEPRDKGLRRPIDLFVGKPFRKEGQMQQGRMAFGERIEASRRRQPDLFPQMMPGSSQPSRYPIDRPSKRAPKVWPKAAQSY